MLNYHDQHMHTHHSFDSEEIFENYMKYTDGLIVSTEHYDLRNPYSNYEDTFPDYADYSIEIDTLNQKYGKRFLKGIEVGYTKRDVEAIRKYLDNKAYDVILLSFHQNGEIDFMDDKIIEQSLEETMDEYFGLMLEGVRDFDEANILTHFEYGLRRYEVTIEALKTREDLLSEIFKEAIKKELAFELNSKSMYRYQNAHLYRYAIPLYQSLGGKLFTLGSDAHVAEDHSLYFERSVEMLKSFGVEELAVYIDRELHMVSLAKI